MNKSLLAIAVASLLTPISYLHAQEVSADETMVVTANRFEQTEASVLASVTVIDRQQIESSQATTALDLLKTVPGVTINSLGTKANSTSIYIRGTASKHALVLVDGVRINSATGGGASIGLIPAFAIEKIEVVRGPRAAVYGSDAVGGVINISTVPESGSAHELKVGFGNQGQDQQGWRSVGEISEQTRGSFVFNREQSEGYRIYDLAPENDTHGYTAETVFGNLQHTINDEWSAFFAGFSSDSSSEYAGQYDGVKGQLDDEFYSIAAGAVFQQEVIRSELQLSTTKAFQANGDAAGLNAKSTLTSYRNSASWLNTYTGIEKVTLNAGLDYYEEKANRGGTNTTDYEKTKKDNKAVFVTSHIDFSPVIAELSVRHDKDSAFGGETTWNAALGYDVTERIQVVASSGTAFKAPTFNDLYWPESPWDKGNPDLKPEESQSSEVAIYGYFDLADWSITAYQSEIENLIDWAPEASSGKWTPSNVEEAEIKGIEATVAFVTGPVSHNVVGEWIDPKDTKTKKDLVRRPQEKFSWAASYQYGDFDAALTALYTGTSLDKNGDELQSYTTVDLGLGYQATDALSLGLRANNLFDKEYVTGNGTGTSFYHGAERNYLATATYQF